MKPLRRIDWRTASVAGLLFAMFMSLRVWADRDPGFDELAIRFAVYFVIFTAGFYFLYNMIAGRKR